MPDNNMASKELPFSIHIIGNTIGAMADILALGSDWQLVTESDELNSISLVKSNSESCL